LRLKTHDGDKTIEGCVRSFAYWDPKLLKAGRLLNAQTGEYLKADLTEGAMEEISVKNRQVKAKKYRLSAGKDVIDLWYTLDNRWVALESTTRIGMKLRYEAL
jgi:hypothetical protein